MFLYIISVTNQPNHIDIYVSSLFDYSAQQWALWLVNKISVSVSVLKYRKHVLYILTMCCRLHYVCKPFVRLLFPISDPIIEYCLLASFFFPISTGILVIFLCREWVCSMWFPHSMYTRGIRKKTMWPSSSLCVDPSATRRTTLGKYAAICINQFRKNFHQFQISGI